jgi:hypothetical protein
MSEAPTPQQIFDQHRATFQAIERGEAQPTEQQAAVMSMSAKSRPVVAAPVATPAPAPKPSGPVQINAADVEWIGKCHAFKTPDGKHPYTDNPKVRDGIEKMRLDIFSGKPVDAEVRARTDAWMRGEKYVAPTEAPPPEGTPEERAIQAAAAKLDAVCDADGVAKHDAFPAEMLNGYSLPPGDYDAVETVRMLGIAKQAGFTQQQINAYIRAQG